MTISGFKKIYFTAMALILVLLLVFSFVTYYTGNGNPDIKMERASTTAAALTSKGERSPYATDKKTGLADAAKEIEKFLVGEGISKLSIRKGGDVASETNYTKITDNYGGAVSYVIQDFADSKIAYGVSMDTCFDMTGDYSAIYGAKQPKNIAVIIPGDSATPRAEREAVLLMTHYDSMPKSVGATNAMNVAAMLEVIAGAKGGDYKNDLVFLFTDGRYDNSVSAYAFKNQFIGLDNVFSRVRAAFNFDALTVGGKLALVQSSVGDAGIVAGYTSAAGTTYSDSALASSLSGSITSDFDIFYDKANEVWNVPALNFMYINGKYEAEGKYDTFDNFDKENVAAQSGALMQSLVEKFGNADLGAVSSDIDAAYASYLNLSLSANAIVTYVLATLLLAMLVFTVFFALKKKVFSVSGLVKGAAITIGVTAASIGLFFAAYFLIGLLVFCFGGITLEMILTMQYLGAAVLIPAILFAAAVSCGWYPLLKRAFRVKATDCVRGGALIISIIAVLMGYIFPPAALQLLIIGFCMTAVMLALTFLKNPIKNKFSVDVERFMPYAWPAMLALPFVVPFILAICNMHALILLPVLLGIVTLLLTSVTPYFDYLQVSLVNLFAKLPKHTIVIEQDVTRDVEDTAKKGKFATVTTREIIKKKVKWKYHNWFGVTVICTVTVIALLVCSLLGSFGSVIYGSSVVNTYNFASYDTSYDSIYNNSLVYYIEKGNSTTPSAYWMIKDASLFTKTRTAEMDDRYFINSFEWNEKHEAYMYGLTHTDESHPIKKADIPCKKGTPPAANVFTMDVVSPISSSSQMVINISNISGVTKVVVRNNKDTFTVDGYSDSSTKLTVTLPFGFGACSIDLYGTAATSVYIDATEYVFDEAKLQSDITSPYMDALAEFCGTDNPVSFGMVVNYKYSVA